ncbi:MAG: hypothetical protein RI968_319 [Pseudomonadota bacterium]
MTTMSGHHAHTNHEHEHEFEPEYGLPERLPANERLLWQGSPVAALVFRHVFHGRGIAFYFLLILVVRSALEWEQTGSLAAALGASTWLAPVFALGLLLFWAMSVLVAKTTVYTITDRRLVFRIGIVLNLSFNIPLHRVRSADVRRLPNGAGEICIDLLEEDKIAYPHLWPHARPWRLSHPQPMMRALPAVESVAALLESAWRNAQSQKSSRPTQVAQAIHPAAGESGLPA